MQRTRKPAITIIIFAPRGHVGVGFMICDITVPDTVEIQITKTVHVPDPSFVHDHLILCHLQQKNVERPRLQRLL